jgi:hypothetical protein
MKKMECDRCSNTYDQVERDCAILEWGKVEYIEDRDLRIISRPSRRELDAITAQLFAYYHTRDIIEKRLICSDCVSEHIWEPSTEYFSDVAELYGIDVDEIFDDPEGYGIPNPLILPTMWRVDFEPETCSGCDTFFSDGDVIAVVTSCDILNGEPIDVEREEGRPIHTFLCPECGAAFDQQYF